MEKDGNYRILCLGESTTKLGDSPSYPLQLENILNEKLPGTTFSVINEGVPATNTTAILSNLEENLNDYNPHVVVTMMGINDYSDTPRQVLFSNTIDNPFLESLRVFKLFKFLLTQVSQNFSFIILQDHTWLYRLNKGIQNDEYFIKLADYYIFQGERFKAMDVLLKAVELYPNSAQVYSELGWYYVYQNENNLAQKMLKKAIELDPKTTEAYVILGRYYRNQQDFIKAERTLSMAVKMNRDNIEAYYELAKSYWDQKNYADAEKVLLEAIKVDPQDADMYSLLAVFSLEQNKYGAAETYFQMSKELRLRSFNQTTKVNYNKLKDIVTKRGIQLVCVQYPMRSVNDLTLLFDNHDGVIFVDNEKIFKDAVANSSYWEYFIDMFATDFGHCTTKGDRLLAQNIVNALEASLSAPGLPAGLDTQ
ncbi:MAG: tetratricopeptide repeat protein [Candidatus Omnitrophica bacterium]|nr:tetratricopeptide repeat protein [Candidatus Omnitrophota bacterium]